VTFDCWATLLYETDPRRAPSVRARILAELTGAEESLAAAALASAWRRHQVEWHRRVVFAGGDITRHALATLGASLTPDRLAELVTRLESEVLEHEVRAVEGAREILESLRRAGIRRALICDTGFAPGAVVRRLLDRTGLLDLLEVTVFSDELGVPKPHARAFTTALAALGVSPESAIHVGDLRRSDIAGARAAGMASVRFRGRHDDGASGPSAYGGVIDCAAAGCDPACSSPEADVVVGSYAELGELLAPLAP
jgi:putative hydrolase of the HAD superfamily